MNKITAQQISDKLNEQGYDYFGDRPRASGDSIRFGKSFVRFENGKLSNNREGHARALTIGWPAVEACEKALAELTAPKVEEAAEIRDERWHEFRTYNTAPQYGYGSDAEADAYLNLINENRDVNQWHRTDVTEPELIATLDAAGSDGFVLSEAFV